jgi:hypothetical protein
MCSYLVILKIYFSDTFTKFSHCPFKNCDTSSFYPLQVELGPHMAWAILKLHLWRATDSIALFFTCFSFTWPPQQKRTISVGPSYNIHENMCVLSSSGWPHIIYSEGQGF